MTGMRLAGLRDNNEAITVSIGSLHGFKVYFASYECVPLKYKYAFSCLCTQVTKPGLINCFAWISARLHGILQFLKGLHRIALSAQIADIVLINIGGAQAVEVD